MPPDAARGRSFRNICGMSPPASGQVTITPPALGQTRYRTPRLAKSFFHPSEPSLIIAVDAVRVDPEQHLDGVPGPLGHQGPGVPALRRQETPAWRRS